MRLESCITRLQMRLFLGGVQSGTENFLYVSRDVNFLRAQKGSSRGVYIEAPPPPPPPPLPGGGSFSGFSGFSGKSPNSPHFSGDGGRTLRQTVFLILGRWLRSSFDQSLICYLLLVSGRGVLSLLQPPPPLFFSSGKKNESSAPGVILVVIVMAGDIGQ